jgi:MFS family permease
MSEREAAPGEAARRWSLTAAIASVTAFGASVGFATPLFSLTLDARGTDTFFTGLNATSAFLGVLFGPLWTPHLVRRLGVRRFLLACLALDIVFFLAMKPLDGLGAWFVLRLLLGVAGSSLFTATEAWINTLASDRHRGRIIGAYATSLAAGFGIGPLLLGATGTKGWTPYLACAGITALAALPLAVAGEAASGIGSERASSALAMARRAPFIVLAVAFYGFFEQTTLSLLPIWGVRIGLAPATAAALLTAIGVGSIALQMPVGWLSDKLERVAVLRLCGIAGLVGALLLPLLASLGPLPVFAAVMVWGGAAAGIYPVALAMAGARFRGAELIGVNAAIIIAYGAGSLLGPSLGGLAMDLWNPQGLPAEFAVLFVLFLAATLLGRRRAAA